MLDGELEVAPGYPQSTARDWLVCGEPQAGTSVEGLPAGPQGRSGVQDGLAVCSCSGAGRTLPLLLPPLLPSALGALARAP